MGHLSRLILSSLIFCSCMSKATIASFTITTSFNSGYGSLAISPQFGPGGSFQLSSYTTSVSQTGWTPLNLAGEQVTASPVGLTNYSSNFRINITIREDRTNNVGRIILDDSMRATTGPEIFNNTNIFGYDFSDSHLLSLDPSSGSPAFLGRYAETIVDGTLFSLDLYTFNTCSNFAKQATSGLADPYVELYAQPGVVPEPCTAAILTSGLGIVFAANRILKRRKIRSAATWFLHSE